MEAERRQLGLEGVHFLYYECPDCGHGDVFLDLHPLDGESPETFRARRRDLEEKVRQLHDDRIEVVITEKGAW